MEDGQALGRSEGTGAWKSFARFGLLLLACWRASCEIHEQNMVSCLIDSRLRDFDRGTGDQYNVRRPEFEERWQAALEESSKQAHAALAGGRTAAMGNATSGPRSCRLFIGEPALCPQ